MNNYDDDAIRIGNQAGLRRAAAERSEELRRDRLREQSTRKEPVKKGKRSKKRFPKERIAALILAVIATISIGKGIHTGVTELSRDMAVTTYTSEATEHFLEKRSTGEDIRIYYYDIDATAENVNAFIEQNPTLAEKAIFLTYNSMGANAENRYNNMDNLLHELAEIAKSDPTGALAQELGQANDLQEYIESKGYNDKEAYKEAMKDSVYNQKDELKEAFDYYNDLSQKQGRSR